MSILYVVFCDCRLNYILEHEKKYKIVKIINRGGEGDCTMEVGNGMPYSTELHARKAIMSRPLLSEIVLHGPDASVNRMSLWRTPWNVYHEETGAWIPIVDVTYPELIPGEFVYSLVGDTTEEFFIRLGQQLQIRQKMIMVRPHPPVLAPLPPTAPLAPLVALPPHNPHNQGGDIVPPFIAQAIKADAIRNSQSCPISLDVFTQEVPLVLTQCYHMFNRNALVEWLQTHETCPVCISNITSQQVI